MPELTYQPLNVRLATDARSGRFDLADDQSWELAFGKRGDEPAIAVQTRYGGRVGLARVVPVIQLDGQILYEKSSLAHEFRLTNLAPDAVQVEAEIIRGLTLNFLIWVIDSHSLGGRFVLKNQTGKDVSLELGLHVQAIIGEKMLPAKQLQIKVPQGMAAGLSIHEVGNLTPVLLMEGGQGTDVAKLVVPLELEHTTNKAVRFVLSSLPTMDESLKAAHYWLSETTWRRYTKDMNERLTQLPTIETGDDNLDAAIALSWQVLMRSLVKGNLPHPAPAFVRSPAYNSFDEGQTALDTLFYAATLAILEPKLAQGIILNYLNFQQQDGWVDGAPKLSGEGSGYLVLPILAQLAEIVFHYHKDVDFLRLIFFPLLKYYSCWFEQDADRDGFPEWLSVQQANFVNHPTFSMIGAGGIPADIRLAECPDLIAYLLAEGEALERLSSILGRKGESEWKKIAESRYKSLIKTVQMAWKDNRFYYLDRDSNRTSKGDTLYTGNGEKAMSTRLDFDPPQRLIIHTEGGVNQPSKLRAIVTGQDYEGKPVQEVIDNFSWYRGQGAAATQTIWHRVSRVQVEGLSRVYKYTLKLPALDRHDVTLLFPYISQTTPKPQQAILMNWMSKYYWHKYGLSTLPSTDPAYARTDTNSQHVVLPFMQILGLGMLRNGDEQRSGELFLNIVAGQVKALMEQGSFFQWYNAEDGGGLGLPDHVSGIIPIHWLMELIGVRVLDSKTVEITGAFGLKRGVRVKWHGVRYSRNTRGLKIKFPSGYEASFLADVQPQVVMDKRR